MLIDLQIKGVSPILMNRYTEETEAKIAKGTGATLRGKKGTPREQASPKRYIDKDGWLILPGPNLWSALVDAGKFHKVGRAKLTTAKSSLVPSFLQIVEPELYFSNGDGCTRTKHWEVDSRTVVIPATGGRIPCHRPRLDTWALSCTLDVDTDGADPALVRTLVDDAGRKIGIGDFRPARKGPFGRFVVVHWHEQRDPVKMS